jgi:hypothetical protein
MMAVSDVVAGVHVLVLLGDGVPDDEAQLGKANSMMK